MKTESTFSVILSGAAALAGFALLIVALSYQPAGSFPAFGAALTADQWAMLDAIESTYNEELDQ